MPSDEGGFTVSYFGGKNTIFFDTDESVFAFGCLLLAISFCQQLIAKG